VIELNVAFFIQLINFGVLVLVLNLFLFKPIRKVLADRRQVIEFARNKTVSVEREVQEKMASYEIKLADAKAEAALRRAAALRQAQEEEALLLDKARKEAAAQLASICDKVAKESDNARELLKKQAGALSGNIIEKILGRSL
jgi:F-type H+-transporting ATPase subunit b